MKSKTPNPIRNKSDSRYWLTRVFKPISGSKVESPNYAMQICFKRHRLAFGLRTGNKYAAASIARNIYLDLVTLGVEATLAKQNRSLPSKKNT